MDARHLTLVLVAGLSAALPQARSETRQDFYRSVAAYHAPVIIQGLGAHPRGDEFTRFDFNGNTNAYTKWHDLDRFPTPAYVYYDVIETTTHFFISYSLYYPRDYAPLCFWFECHENDYEGMRIVVEKTADSEYGRVWLLETFAHGHLSIREDPGMMGATHPRVLIIVDKEGHGVHAFGTHDPEKRTRVFNYTGVAQDPDVEPSSAFSYDLLPLTYLWDLRANLDHRTGTFRTTFDYEGERFHLGPVPATFGGKKWGKKQVNPPWAWDGGKDVKKGDWFFDPALAICKRIKCPEGFGQVYLHNTYLGIE